MSEIPCCTCGKLVAPNDRGQCIDCIRAEVDLTAGIPRTVALDRCSVCGAWHRNPQWVTMPLESPQLLSLCLKRTKGLSGPVEGVENATVKLSDASWIWTEPHSKRLKVKITVRSDLMSGMALEQQCVVEYVLHGGQCTACERAAAQQTWRALVQLRQKATTARVLHYLEQLILAGGAAVNAHEIKAVKGGIDFYFPARQQAEKLVAFVNQYAMTRVKTSSTLVTHNERAGTANVRLTWAVEVAPVCKDDLVLLPKATAASLGLPSPLCVVAKVGRTTQLVDAQSAATAYLSEAAYWKEPFRPLLSRRMAKKFEVLDIDADTAGHHQGPKGAGSDAPTTRFLRADAQVVRGEDYDKVMAIWTHLGRVLKPGDTALGYDVAGSSIEEDISSEMPAHVELPDVVLVGKVHTERKFRRRKGTFTRNRKGNRRVGSQASGSETSSLVSATESEMAQELDGLLDELALRDAGGALDEPGLQLEAMELRTALEPVDDEEEEAEEEEAREDAQGAGEAALMAQPLPGGGEARGTTEGAPEGAAARAVAQTEVGATTLARNY